MSAATKRYDILSNRYNPKRQSFVTIGNEQRTLDGKLNPEFGDCFVTVLDKALGTNRLDILSFDQQKILKRLASQADSGELIDDDLKELDKYLATIGV